MPWQYMHIICQGGLNLVEMPLTFLNGPYCVNVACIFSKMALSCQSASCNVALNWPNLGKIEEEKI